MAQNVSKSKQVSLRMANEIHSQVNSYAKKHNLSFSKATEKLIEAGLQVESEPLATRKDIERLITETENLKLQNETTRAVIVKAIENQPIAVQQQLPEVSEKPHKSFRGLFKRKESK